MTDSSENADMYKDYAEPTVRRRRNVVIGNRSTIDDFSEGVEDNISTVAADANRPPVSRSSAVREPPRPPSSTGQKSRNLLNWSQAAASETSSDFGDGGYNYDADELVDDNVENMISPQHGHDDQSDKVL